ncbi:PiggyBac transposable element-derived protein 4 [Anthophora plagiata]
MYWTTSEVFKTPIFSKLLTYRRYYYIQKNLHFCNNKDYNPETHPQPKLNKIWPVFESINNKCSSLYIPERDISIDESLMLYKGRLSWQCLPLKRSRFGIKTFMLCEANTGYIYSQIIYTGKGTIINEEYKNLSQPTSIILTLAEPLLDKGCCIITDNYYTSLELASILLTRNTDIYGTVRQNRKHIPAAIKTEKLKRGEKIAFQDRNICILKWKDKKDVVTLSTIHNADMTTVQKNNETKIVPKVVSNYNFTMGGVDKADQNLRYYSTTRSRGKKYYF